MKVNLGEIIVNSEMHISGITVKEETNIGNVKLDYVKEFPELEDLEIIPTTEEQNFKSSKYGYNNVKVNAIETEELNLVLEKEAQVKEGLFSKVTLDGMKITNAQYLFYGGARLEHLDLLLDLCGDVNNTSYMFGSCTSLTTIDLSKVNTLALYNVANMFNGCSNLKEANLSHFNTSGVANMGSLFNNCTKLTNVNLSDWNTSNVTGAAQMFQGCKALVNLDLSHCDFGKVNSIISAFGNCTNLTNFKSPKNVGKAFTQKSNNYQPYQQSYSSSTKLTHESLMDIINNLYDLNLIHNTANGGTLYTQKLTLGTTNLAKLTAQEIAIATNKGWTVA